MSKAPTKSMWSQEDEDFVIGYMCLTDFECEIGGAWGGRRLFQRRRPTEEPFVRCRMRIVEVEVRARHIVEAAKG